MEFLPKDRLFLVVKIQCADPEQYESAKILLPVLGKRYEHGSKILTLLFPASNVDSILTRFCRAFPRAPIVETGLTASPGAAGYSRRITDHISIASPGPDVAPHEGQILIRSSLSFGSGFHPTTELSIKLLEQAFFIRDIQKVFDLGTGSGILALTAARLGAKNILATDIDFQACQEARENIALNNAGHRISVLCGSYSCARQGAFDLVLANLTISTFITIGHYLPPLLKPGGLLVVSGFTPKQSPSILSVLHHTELVNRSSLEGWTGLLLKALPSG